MNTPHTVKAFDQELNALTRNVTAMGEFAGVQFLEAVRPCSRETGRSLKRSLTATAGSMRFVRSSPRPRPRSLRAARRWPSIWSRFSPLLESPRTLSASAISRRTSPSAPLPSQAVISRRTSSSVSIASQTSRLCSSRVPWRRTSNETPKRH